MIFAASDSALATARTDPIIGLALDAILAVARTLLVSSAAALSVFPFRRNLSCVRSLPRYRRGDWT